MLPTNKLKTLLAAIACTCILTNSFGATLVKTNKNLERAQLVLDSVYKYYGIEGSHLLRETYPFDKGFRAGYLGAEDTHRGVNLYSYLWPFSSTLSATSALFGVTKSPTYKKALDNNVLKGLENYADTKRQPWAYSSYVNTSSPSDRFYDDNVWVGLDFTDLYLNTREEKYLNKAKDVWKFIQSGTDNQLGGGIFWKEQDKNSKNTCSNAPGSVYALKLYMATSDKSYLEQGEALYLWTKKTLQDTSDYLYFDNINLNKNISKAKFGYNSGQMIQAAVLLYTITKNKMYLTDAQNTAKACHNYFFETIQPEKGEAFRILKNGEIWFSAIMLRGLIELYKVDGNRTYIDDVQKTMDYSWDNARSKQGLYDDNWKKASDGRNKKLLTQGAIVEMYARLGGIYK